jgi:hypothetical protein
LAQELHKRERRTPHRRGAVTVALIIPQYAEGGLTQPHRLFQHCVEDWSELAG